MGAPSDVMESVSGGLFIPDGRQASGVSLSLSPVRKCGFGRLFLM